MNDWYSRPIFFVADVARSLSFYSDALGFVPGFRYEEDEKLLVAQVGREGCDIILSAQQPERVGYGRIFISVDLAPLQALRSELERRGATVSDGWWGYDTMIVTDPDGNELCFPYPADETR